MGDPEEDQINVLLLQLLAVLKKQTKYLEDLNLFERIFFFIALLEEVEGLQCSY